MKLFASAMAVVLMAATPVAAAEHHLVKWRKTGQCEIIPRLPYFGNHWITLATFNSRFEAEREMERLRMRRDCPPHAPDPRPRAQVIPTGQ